MAVMAVGVRVMVAKMLIADSWNWEVELRISLMDFLPRAHERKHLRI